MDEKKDKNSGAITYAMDKLTEAINSLDIDEPPLKSWSEIKRDMKKRQLKLIEGGEKEQE